MRLMQFRTQAFNLRLACTASSRSMVGRENTPEIFFFAYISLKKTKAIDPPSPLSIVTIELGFFF